METLDELSESGSFGMDLAKTFALSAASTAGLLGGLFLVGVVLEAVKKRDEKKKATKLQTAEK